MVSRGAAHDRSVTPAELAVAADRARAAGDTTAGRLRLDTLKAVLDTWRTVEPRLARLDPARAHYLQYTQDEVRDLLIDPDRWPVGEVVTLLMDALAPLTEEAPSAVVPDSAARARNPRRSR